MQAVPEDRRLGHLGKVPGHLQGIPQAVGVHGQDGLRQGLLQVPGVALDMTITMARSAEGTWFAELDIPLQSVSALPLESASQAAPVQ